MSERQSIKVDVMPITDGATPDPQNVNKHTQRGSTLLQNSLRKRGAFRSIASAGKGADVPVIYAGNLTHEMAVDAGFTEIVNVHVTGNQLVNVVRDDIAPGSPEAIALGIEDNQIGKESADIDVLAALASGDNAVLAVLRDEDKLFNQMVERMGIPSNEPQDSEPQIDMAEKLREKWKTESGQTWLIGDDGKLFVGPAELAHINCDFAIYDPPFDWSASQQENSLSWVLWKNCALMGLHYCMPLSSRKDWLHWWVWDAGVARFGGKGYHPTKTCAVIFAFGEKERFHETACNVIGENYPSQIVRITHPIQGKEHPQEKPMKLCEYIVALYSSENETIGDPFAGSGTFALASLQMKRKYHGAEIDPGRCAVILERASTLGFSCAVQSDADYNIHSEDIVEGLS